MGRNCEECLEPTSRLQGRKTGGMAPSSAIRRVRPPSRSCGLPSTAPGAWGRKVKQAAETDYGMLQPCKWPTLRC